MISLVKFFYFKCSILYISTHRIFYLQYINIYIFFFENFEISVLFGHQKIIFAVFMGFHTFLVIPTVGSLRGVKGDEALETSLA
jgi:hypothetical protein